MHAISAVKECKEKEIGISTCECSSAPFRDITEKLSLGNGEDWMVNFTRE
jgi:hypothetical protein